MVNHVPLASLSHPSLAWNSAVLASLALGLVVFVLVALAGISAAVLYSRHHLRHQRLVQVTRRDLAETKTENLMLRTNHKHTKAARRVHDKAEAALFAVIKARDEQRRLEHIIDNAAEHVAAIVRGD